MSKKEENTKVQNWAFGIVLVIGMVVGAVIAAKSIYEGFEEEEKKDE